MKRTFTTEGLFLAAPVHPSFSISTHTASIFNSSMSYQHGMDPRSDHMFLARPYRRVHHCPLEYLFVLLS